ncbi:MAG: carboxymuconolactone decarboxylase family protein [Eubacteriales bacterium]
MSSKPKEPKEILNKFLTGMKDLSSQEQHIEKSYEKLLKSVYDGTGNLDEKTKELISIGIAVHGGFETPIVYHVNQAFKAGAKEEEIIEAALVAIVSGGLKSLASIVTTVKEAVEAFK